MPTIAPAVTPYYGGGQVLNPADTIQTSGAPSTANINHNLGTIAVDNAAGVAYILVSKSGGSATWAKLEASGSGGSFTTLTSTGATTLATTGASVNTFGNTTGTTSVTIRAGSGGITLTGAVGSSAAITAGTSLTATLGAITATNGNLVLGTAGNKLLITAGSNASVGVSGNMSGTPGVIAVSTTACTASSVILFSRATTGGTPGQVSITAQSTSGFTLTSTGNETSTFNWLIIN